MKILLAEDDHNIQMIAKMVLEEIGGHQVQLADDGEVALAYALNETFDIILMDEMMPKMNGLSVSKQIKMRSQDVGFPNTLTPIIFLSAKSHGSEVEEFKKYGDGFIAKPFEPRTLCAEIEALKQKITIKREAQ